ncbi:MAG TPA: tRNA lysidine(34) synthetase TilS [Steroidobacteraceae bacterium]|nr:tRNA lysidine(34) synthetase TilS [Steroidobacteraceae bacterium]
MGWSGGLDSTVLLHLMLRVRRAHPRQIQIRAVHVDHHLQAASAQFRAHCLGLARRWRVPITVLDADVKLGRGESLEEAARDARLGCWRSQMRPGELLLLAQHADDQVETTLLALLRGAGPAGLAAMPEAAALGQGQLLRPLLNLPRAALLDYAQRQALPHVEDPTNQQLRFDRNFLRAEVMPKLRQRWPGLAGTVPRSARHCANAAKVLAGQAAQDLAAASDGADLDMAVLRRWHAPRVNVVLRAWLGHLGLRSPETRHLDQMRQMLGLRSDARPALTLPQFTVRVHAGRLVCQTGAAAAQDQPVEQLWSWRRGVLPLAEGSELAVLSDPHGDLDLGALPARLLVRTAPGAMQSHGRRLRKLLQELQVPQWERERLPLLSAVRGGLEELLAVGDLWLHESIRSHPNTSRRGRIVWQMRV